LLSARATRSFLRHSELQRLQAIVKGQTKDDGSALNAFGSGVAAGQTGH
jgi:hypothetical protein